MRGFAGLDTFEVGCTLLIQPLNDMNILAETVLSTVMYRYSGEMVMVVNILMFLQ